MREMGFLGEAVCSRLMIGATLCVALSGSAAQATDYYVSPSGKDRNAGTSISRPWQTLSKVSKSRLLAGDRVFLQGGQTFSGSLSFGSDDAGTAANPITIGSYGTGRATINAGTGTGISVYNTAGFVIRDLVLRGAWNSSTQSGNTGDGISFYLDLGGNTRKAFVRVDNVDVGGFKKNGLSLGAWPSDATKSGFDDVRITNSAFHDNGDGGLVTYGRDGTSGYSHSNFYIGNCRFLNNKGIVNKGTNSGSGAILAEVNGATIERCVANGNGHLNNHTGGGPVGIWTYASNNVLIQLNEAYGNSSGTIDGGGFDLDGGATNCVMQYNYSHDNKGPGYLLAQFVGARPFGNNVVRYNVSQNDRDAGIYFWNMGDVKVYNNTVYNSLGPAFKTISNLNNVSVYNNIFFVTGGNLLDIYGTSGMTFRGNNYWSSGAFNIKWGGSNYSSLSAWSAATGQENNGSITGSQVNPQLENAGGGATFGDANQIVNLSAYKLQSNSPLIDSGLNLTAFPYSVNIGSRDYFGNVLPQGNGYDVGAHEFVATP